MSLSLQDYISGFDPTAYQSITGAQLLSLVQAATPYSDKGMVAVTADDITGSPTVPNAYTTTKWQNYLWLRVTSTTTIPYVWNANGTDLGDGFLKWKTLISSTIAPGSITGTQIALNTVTDANISNMSASKLIGSLPAGLGVITTATACAGVLGGTYAAPTLSAASVTTSSIVANAVTGGVSGSLATGANGVDITQNIAPTASSYLGNPSGATQATAAGDSVVLNAAKTAYITVHKAIQNLAEPSTSNPYFIASIGSGGSTVAWQGLGTIAANTAGWRYTSGNLGNPGSGATGSANHGLGAVPTKVRIVLVCLTTNNGYSVGDEVDATSMGSIFSVGANSTAVFFAQVNNATPSIIPKGGGAASAITSADWTVKLYCEI